MQFFTITFIDEETKLMRTIDEHAVDIKSLIDIFAEKYKKSTIIKVVPRIIKKEKL